MDNGEKRFYVVSVNGIGSASTVRIVYVYGILPEYEHGGVELNDGSGYGANDNGAGINGRRAEVLYSKDALSGKRRELAGKNNRTGII